MKRIFLSIASLAAAFAVAQNANAQGYIRGQAMYMSEGSGNGTIVKTTRTLMDVGGGWIHSSGFTLGALYGTESVQHSSGVAASNRASFGLTIGYMTEGNQGFYLLGTYFMTSTLDSYKGTGYEIDLGYKLPLGSVGLGVQVSYKRFKYDEFGSAKVDPAYEQEYVDPYFVIFASF